MTKIDLKDLTGDGEDGDLGEVMKKQMAEMMKKMGMDPSDTEMQTKLMSGQTVVMDENGNQITDPEKMKEALGGESEFDNLQDQLEA